MTKVLSVTLVVVGGASLIVAYFTETYIDSDGLLHEPFAQCVIGYLLVIAGLVIGLLAWRRKRGNPKPPI
jgi:hypothetical protein